MNLEDEAVRELARALGITLDPDDPPEADAGFYVVARFTRPGRFSSDTEHVALVDVDGDWAAAERVAILRAAVRMVYGATRAPTTPWQALSLASVRVSPSRRVK